MSKNLRAATLFGFSKFDIEFSYNDRHEKDGVFAPSFFHLLIIYIKQTTKVRNKKYE